MRVELLMDLLQYITHKKKIPAAVVIIPLFIGMLINLVLNTTLSQPAFDKYSGIVSKTSIVLLMALVFGLCSQLNFKKIATMQDEKALKQ